MSPGFKQQLVRTLKRGCPVCQSHEFTVFFMDVSKVTVTEERGRLQWGSAELLSGRNEASVICAHCDTTLWTPEDGWIAGLADLEAG